MANDVPQRIADRYEIHETIGQGGMGMVYRGLDTQSGEAVAIKSLRPELATPDHIERFRREGAVLRQLNHPNIIKMLDAIEDHDRHFLIMELVGGGSLRDLLADQLPIQHGLEIALDICDALTRAHRLEVIHRDIKPANVLIAQDGTLRLTDFGMARIGVSDLTDSNDLVGTLAYIAPESLNGQQASVLTDVWAFGVMLFEMMAGKRPFTGDSLGELVSATLSQPPPDLEALRPDIPVPLVDLIYRMLAKNEAERIPSMRLVGAEIEAILHGRGIEARLLIQHRTRLDDASDEMQTLIGKTRHNLPIQTTPFVGRESELAQLERLLSDPEKRLVTIIAPGGMGKTRLGLEIASRFVTTSSQSPVAFRDGIYFVELAPLSNPNAIVSLLAETVGYPFQQNERTPRQQLLDFLREKHMLLVLDNFEHVLDGASLVTEILQAAPNIQIIATSRQRLNQLGETIFNLEGMDYPNWETPEDALEYSAVQLFMQSARRIRIEFELQSDDLPHVARICRLVHGMPLGIVLAAAWLDMLSLAEIAAEIAQSLDFLSAEIDDLPSRQRSLRAVFDYSWEMLPASEREVFMKLSIFRGGFTRQAAQTVTGASLRDLQAMVNKSLLRRDAASGRYTIHELLRHFGEESLDASGQANEMRDAHAAYYSEVLRQREPDLKGRRQVDALNEIEADIDNIQAGWGWAIRQKAFEVLDGYIDSLRLFFYMRGKHQENLDFFSLGVEGLLVEEDKRLFGRVCARRAAVMSYFGEHEASEVALRQCLHWAQSTNDKPEIAFVLRSLSFAVGSQGRPDEALQLAKDAVTLCHETGDTYWLVQSYRRQAHYELILGNHDASRNLVKESVTLARNIGDVVGLAMLLPNHSGFLPQSQLEEKEQYLWEGLAYAHEVNHPIQIAWIGQKLSGLFLFKGDLDEAEKWIVESLELARHIQSDVAVSGCLLVLATLTTSKGDFQASYQYLLEAQPLIRKVGSFSQDLTACAVMGWTLCGLRDYPAVAASLHEALAMAQKSQQLREYVLGGMAVWLGFGKEQYERAAELFSLYIHHPDTPPWALQRDALLTSLHTRLQNELDLTAFSAAWERGKQLDLDTVIAALLEEYRLQST